jgi:uracil-DNA glycosylase
MAAMVQGWRARLEAKTVPRKVPLPHPSWRNNGWLAANPWFEREMLPAVRREVHRLVA